MSDATQIVECEKSPTGQHTWWSTTWAHSGGATDALPPNTYCIYCGKNKVTNTSDAVVFRGDDGTNHDTYTR